jgi:hypothetical protein
VKTDSGYNQNNGGDTEIDEGNTVECGNAEVDHGKFGDSATKVY